jgi:hypothetical protein
MGDAELGRVIEACVGWARISLDTQCSPKLSAHRHETVRPYNRGRLHKDS